MSSLKLQKPPLKRRQKTIACPRCKARQPLAHTCSSCGFDIKAYVLEVKGIRSRTQKADKNEQLTKPATGQASTVIQEKHISPQPSATETILPPGKQKSVSAPKCRTIACPGCRTRQPLGHTCAHCGFDIKAYVLDQKGIRPRTQQQLPDNEGVKHVHASDVKTAPVQLPEDPRHVSAEPKTNKKRDLMCPDCRTRQPFAYICVTCGLDFRALALKHRQETVAASLKKTEQMTASITAPPEVQEIPGNTIAPVMAQKSVTSVKAESSSELTPLQDLEAYLQKYIEELMTPVVETEPGSSTLAEKESVESPVLSVEAQREPAPLNEVEVEAHPVLYVEAMERPREEPELDPELADVVAELVASSPEPVMPVQAEAAPLAEKGEKLATAFAAESLDTVANPTESHLIEPEVIPSFSTESLEPISPASGTDKDNEKEIDSELLDVVAGLVASAAESDRFDLPENEIPSDAKVKEQVAEAVVKPASAKQKVPPHLMTKQVRKSTSTSALTARTVKSETRPKPAMKRKGPVLKAPVTKGSAGTAPSIQAVSNSQRKIRGRASQGGAYIKTSPIKISAIISRTASASWAAARTRAIQAGTFIKASWTKTSTFTSRAASASWAAARIRAIQAGAFIKASWTKASAFTSRTASASWAAARTRAIQAGAFIKASWKKTSAFTSRTASAIWTVIRTRAIQAETFITERYSAIKIRRLERKQMPPPALYPERQETGAGEAIPMAALAHRAWQDLRKRAGILMGIWGAGLALYSIPVMAALWAGPYLGQWSVTMFALAAAAGVIGLGRTLCLLIAATVDQDASFRIALYRGTHLFVPTVLAGLLVLCLASWGPVFLIVPAIWVLAAGFATFPILYLEKESWVKAVIKSFDYMDGHIVLVITRLLPLFLLMAGAPILLWKMASPQLGLAGFALSVFMVPYALAYSYLLFENIRGMHGRIVLFEVSRRVRLRWMFTGLAGAAASAALMFALYRLVISGRALEYIASLV